MPEEQRSTAMANWQDWWKQKRNSASEQLSWPDTEQTLYQAQNEPQTHRQLQQPQPQLTQLEGMDAQRASDPEVALEQAKRDFASWMSGMQVYPSDKPAQSVSQLPDNSSKDRLQHTSMGP